MRKRKSERIERKSLKPLGPVVGVVVETGTGTVVLEEKNMAEYLW
jgi:hypothetical protein